ncbi:hypothetical protein F2P56_022673, partial [Juglans regia]
MAALPASSAALESKARRSSVSTSLCYHYGSLEYDDIGGGYAWVCDPHFSLSHLLFTDDTLLFCKADRNQLRALKALLLCFEAASGLKVNFDKSKLVLVGTVSNTRQLASIIGCKVASLPITYLGLPLGAAARASSIWDSVIEKIGRKLAGQKRLYLSKGGLLTLIKSTISNLPTYFLSLFQLPASATAQIEKLYHDFLWSGIGDEFKFHLVSWDK